MLRVRQWDDTGFRLEGCTGEIMKPSLLHQFSNRSVIAIGLNPDLCALTPFDMERDPGSQKEAQDRH